LSEKRHAILTTGPIGHGRLEPALQRRLGKGRLRKGDDTIPLIERIAEELSLPGNTARSAATRYLGSSDEPQALDYDDVIVAADPVYLEPRLDHLCLKTQSHSLSREEMDGLVQHLNDCLADAEHRFERRGRDVYLLAKKALASSSFPADAIDDLKPNKYLPTSGDVDAYRRTIAEIEMALHEHPVNLSRAERGLPPINSLWLWGAAPPAAISTATLPPLLSEHPSSVGLWRRFGAETMPLGGLDSVLDAAGGRIVIDAGDAGVSLLPLLLDRCSTLTLFSRDGFEITVTPGDRFRFWRRNGEALSS